MKSVKILTILILGLIFFATLISEAAPMGTAFTFQGRLVDKNKPAEGSYDFQFNLYDSNDPCTGTKLGQNDINDVNAIDGHFVVELDFGSDVFDGNAVWLETTVVRSPMGSDPAVLRPLMEITPTPYALQTRGIFVDPNGNVGIGTTTPQGLLQVGQPIIVTAQEEIGISDITSPEFTPDAKLEIITGNSGKDLLMISSNAAADGDLMIVKNNGNVGIGTDNPGKKLEVNGEVKGTKFYGDGSGLTGITVSDNSVSQAKLKTTTGEVATGSDGDYLTLPGGSYGFYPQLKTSNYEAHQYGAYISKVGIHVIGTSYVTQIWLDGAQPTIIYAQQRYITSSGKNHWIFLKIAKKDYSETSEEGTVINYNKAQTLACYQSSDHPCYGSGGDESDIPHPFGSYNADKHEVVLIDNEILPELKAKVTSKRSLLTVINEDYEVDLDSRPVYQPREIIEIDELGDKGGEIIERIRTPEWAKIMISSDEIFLKRRMVDRLPDYIKYRKLRRKDNETKP